MPKEKSILIVEDNRFMAELLAERFRRAGFAAEMAFDGEAGLQKLKKKTPSLLLLDLLLPGEVSGFDLLQQVRNEKNTARLPVVILTNLEAKEEMAKILELGANAYLVKAYTTTDEIVAKVEDVLESKTSDTVPASGLMKAVAELQGGGARGSLFSVEESKKLRAKIEKLIVSPKDRSIIELVDTLIVYAFTMRASDIHIIPEEERLRVRLRIDGVLNDVFSFPKTIHSEVITRIKVLAGLRTDEHASPQDGRFKARAGRGGYIDVRVSIAPTYYGENCVMRLLAEQAQTFTLEGLGFSAENLKRVYRAIKKPYGMILVTGPTGSGKTTTLYSILKKLNTPEVAIITIEDPIEYSVTGIDQIQVNTKTGLTFANGLRFILRQDPDIIMVGEIRDDETASIAVNAAMTGHLLLSTLHANDAATALPRLIDMKVEPFLIASTVNIIISQRLVRMLCRSCRIPKKLTQSEMENLKEFIPAEILKETHEFYTNKGCTKCGGTGFLSRIGIHEVLEINETIRDLIMRHANAAEIKRAAQKNGMKTMLEDGFEKAAQGITTIEEVLRVFHE